jgi:DNA-directed RNA polymerase subunit RPC12/RpoP
MECISCGKTFGSNLNIADYEGYDLNCPHCGFSMLIENSALIDFNKYLKLQYASAGVKVAPNVDCTKSFVEVK